MLSRFIQKFRSQTSIIVRNIKFNDPTDISPIGLDRNWVPVHGGTPPFHKLHITHIIIILEQPFDLFIN